MLFYHLKTDTCYYFTTHDPFDSVLLNEIEERWNDLFFVDQSKREYPIAELGYKQSATSNPLVQIVELKSSKVLHQSSTCYLDQDYMINRIFVLFLMKSKRHVSKVDFPIVDNKLVIDNGSALVIDLFQKTQYHLAPDVETKLKPLFDYLSKSENDSDVFWDNVKHQFLHLSVITSFKDLIYYSPSKKQFYSNLDDMVYDFGFRHADSQDPLKINFYLKRTNAETEFVIKTHDEIAITWFYSYLMWLIPFYVQDRRYHFTSQYLPYWHFENKVLDSRIDDVDSLVWSSINDLYWEEDHRLNLFLDVEVFEIRQKITVGKTQEGKITLEKGKFQKLRIHTQKGQEKWIDITDMSLRFEYSGRESSHQENNIDMVFYNSGKEIGRSPYVNIWGFRMKIPQIADSIKRSPSGHEHIYTKNQDYLVSVFEWKRVGNEFIVFTGSGRFIIPYKGCEIFVSKIRKCIDLVKTNLIMTDFDPKRRKTLPDHISVDGTTFVQISKLTHYSFPNDHEITLYSKDQQLTIDFEFDYHKQFFKKLKPKLKEKSNLL